MNDFEMHSIVTCPKCGHLESEEIPAGHSTRLYSCKSCHIVITAKPQDCCVFCSYGSNPCLSVQKKQQQDNELSGVITIRLTERLLSPLSKHS